MGRGRGCKKCIIMHVEGGFWQKVHYNALFGGGKREENALNAVQKFREQRRRERFEEDMGREEITEIPRPT
jgi:hypothetical protein